MKYKPLFHITLNHQYYTQGKCDDVALAPTAECLQLMRNYRIKLRQSPAKWELAIQADMDQNPIIPLDPIVHFQFYLQLENQTFPLITRDFAEKEITDFAEAMTLEEAALRRLCFPWLNNYDDPEQSKLNLGIYRYQHREKHTVSRPGIADTFFLQSNPVPDRIAADFVVEGLKGVDTAGEYDSKTKRLFIDTSSAVPGDTFRLQYWSSPPWPPNTFGLVGIQFKSTFLDGGEPTKNFQIQLNAKAANWKYYVLANTNNLNIENSLSFTTDTNPNDEIASHLRLVHPEAKLVLFTSEEVLYQDQLRRGIKLKEETQIKIQHLPNPTPDRNGVAIVNIFKKPS